MEDEAAIRKRLSQSLPDDIFDRQPWRAIVALPLALVLGHAYAMLTFLAHETLHGSVVASRRLQNLIGYFGFGPFLISPHLWRVWHNQTHHHIVNQGDRDPDSFGTYRYYQYYKQKPLFRFFIALAPGSGRWFSYFFLLHWFITHGQIVLWVHSRFKPGFDRFNRKRAIVETFLFLALWILLGIVAGPVDSMFVVFIPMITGSAVLMSYIATNHLMRPQTETNESLDNSMGVTTISFLDRMHFNFSHHVEHHLFPNMNPKFAPRMRRWLKSEMRNRYVSPPHWKALLYLYCSPRLYLDANTLIEPDTGKRVDIGELTDTLIR